MNPYDAVLTDLRAKRDAMSELIAALENVGRLGVSSATLTTAIGGPADNGVRPSVRPSVRPYKGRASAREGEARPEGDRRALCSA